MSKSKLHVEITRVLLFILITTTCMLTFAAVQPFGDGPDEINRFKIVEYIYQHGTLPVGSDPEVLIDGYGGSYAFQPMLTYMIDGYLLRCLRVFEPSLDMRVFISRLVSVFTGILTALYTKKLGDLLFSNKKTAWAFTLAVVFLPQNLFIHTYVNTDSMGLFSIALVLYALVLGIKDDFSKKTCITLAIGVILCALSYYNCYGIIVCAVLFFLAYFWKKCRTVVNTTAASDNGPSDTANTVVSSELTTRVASVPAYDYRSLLKKGIFISVIVLVCISWWFIRNAILYDGDLLALEARNICAAKTGLESYNPYTRDTYQRLGIPLMEMIFGTDYFTLVWKSFIAMFGPMLIPTHHYIYMAFRDLFFMAVIGLFIPLKSSALTRVTRSQKWLVNLTMILAIIIPVILALYYSYTFDFQPQGRYYLPMVVPFMYFLTIGVEKLIALMVTVVGKLGRVLRIIKTEAAASNVQKWTAAAAYHLLYAFLTLCLLYATFVSMLGYYRAG